MSGSGLKSLLELGIKYQLNGSIDQAKTIYKEIIASYPNDGHAFHFLGVICHHEGDDVQACELITRSIVLSPKNPDALYNRAKVFQSLARIDDAIRDLELAIKINPRFVEALNNLGVLLSERGKKSKARFMWDRALSVNPKHTSSLLNRGSMLIAMNKYLEAIDDFNNVLLHKNKSTDTSRAMEGILDAYCLSGNWHFFYKLFRETSSVLWREKDLEFDELYVKSLFNTKSRVAPLRRRDRFRFLLRLFDDVSLKEGRIAECGCFMGLSSLLICERIRKRDPHFKGYQFEIYDSFEGLSEPSREDLADLDVNDATKGIKPREELIQKGAFRASLVDVMKTLSDFPDINFFKGWIPQTFIQSRSVEYKFVHIDVDLFEPTLQSLEYFWPRLIPGGIIVSDDYAWNGAQRAINLFSKKENVALHVSDHGQAFFIKP